MEQIDSVDSNTLFLALTRPAMQMGVTMDAFYINIIIAFCTFVLTKNIFLGLIWVPLHVLCVFLCRKDVNWFSLFLAKKRLVKSENKNIWKGVSYEPF
jgi:type IV secretion system protein VirB3